MNQSKLICERFCQQDGHENEKLLPSLCIAEQCDKKSRLLCQECLFENLHLHGQERPQYLKKEKFLELLNTNIEALRQSHQQGYIKSSHSTISVFQIIDQINSLCQNYKEIYNQLKNPFSDQDEIYFQSLRNQINDQFQSLSNENVNDILKISQQYQLNTQNKIQLNKICKELIDKSQNLIHELNNLNQSSLNFQKFDDKITCIQIQSETTNVSSVKQMKICPNNKYIALLCDYRNNYQLKLFDFTRKQYLKLEYDQNPIRYYQFSSDSQYLYYQEENKPFIRFQIKDQKLEQYKHFLELNTVRFITQISSNIVYVINKQTQIQKLDFQFENKLIEQQSKSQLRELLYDRINNILISSGDFIQFWQVADGAQIYEDNKNLKLDDLKFNERNSQIIGFNQQNLYVIKIVNRQKVFQLNILQQLKFDEAIISFSIVLSQQFIVVFGESGLVKIYNSDFQMRKQLFVGLNKQLKQQFIQGVCSDDLSTMTIGSNNQKLFLTIKVGWEKV